MTASNTYLEPYGPLASQQGLDTAGPLAAAMNFQKGVDGQIFYATDIRQLLVWDNTTFGTWTPADAKALISASAPRLLFDDFRAGSLDSRYVAAVGSGDTDTSGHAASIVSGDAIGEVTLMSNANGTTDAADASSLTLGLNWTPSSVQSWQAVGATASAGAGTFKQKMTLQAKAKMGAISSAAFFLGFNDALASTLEMPLKLTTATLAANATNAVGFLFDTAATTKHVWCVSVNGGTVCATPVDSSILGPALAAGTYLFYKVTVDTSGNATFWMAPVPASGSPAWVQVGTIAAAVSAAASLTPIAVVTARSAAAQTLTLDAWAAT